MRGQKSYKYRLYTVAIAFFLYLAIAGFPFERVGLTHDMSLLCVSFLRLAYAILFSFVIWHEGFLLPSILPKGKGRAWAFIPLFVLCFSNLLVMAFSPSFNSNIEWSHLANYAFYYLSLSLAEEILFRFLIESMSKEKLKPLFSILLSSGIFALSHAVNFFSGAGVGITFAQIGYTFVLGLILGLIYEYDGGVLQVVLFHFLFDFINNGLFVLVSKAEWDLPFYLVNAIIGLLVIAYGAFLFWRLEKERLKTLALLSSNNEKNKIG